MSRDVLGVQGSPVGFYVEILADDNFDTVPGGILVAAAARDGSDTYLTKGLILVKITSGTGTGQYAHFNSGASNGQQDASTAVVLMHDVDVSSTEPQIAAAYMKCSVYSSYLRGQPSLAADKAKYNQRIMSVDYVRQ
jgi:hypothetical protein